MYVQRIICDKSSLPLYLNLVRLYAPSDATTTVITMTAEDTMMLFRKYLGTLLLTNTFLYHPVQNPLGMKEGFFVKSDSAGVNEEISIHANGTTTIASNNNIPTAFKIFPILFIYLPFSVPLLILEKSTIITINMIPMRIDIAEALPKLNIPTASVYIKIGKCCVDCAGPPAVIR